MPPVRMVPLTSVPDAFTAKVVAARLGAEGILWELRGNVGGPYPGGPVQVLVDEDDLTLASLLLEPVDPGDAGAVCADGVPGDDDGQEGDGDDEDGWAPRPRAAQRWFVALTLVALLVLVLARSGLHLLVR